MVFCFGSNAFAQYEQGDITVSGGFSMGVFSYNGWGSYGKFSGFPPLFFNLEYSVNEKVAIGPYLGYYGRTFKSGGYKSTFTAVSYGARGTFHASEFLSEVLDLSINEEKVDVYASLMMGFDTYSYKFDEDWYGDSDRLSDTEFDFGTIIGIRYNFTPQAGAFFEFGRGTFGLATIGASVKF